MGKIKPLLLMLVSEKYKKEFIAKDEYPIAFIDDFKDIISKNKKLRSLF